MRRYDALACYPAKSGRLGGNANRGSAPRGWEEGREVDLLDSDPAFVLARRLAAKCRTSAERSYRVADCDTSLMTELRSTLLESFRWRSDPPAWPEERAYFADYSLWWREATVLHQVGAALAGLFPDAEATVVLGSESHGSLVGALVATHLGTGFAEVRKEPQRASDDDAWLTQRTRPDYRDRQLELAVRRSVLRGGDRVLFVDDWAASGGQALACQGLVNQAGAHWIGAAVIVDGLESAATRRELNLRSVLRLRELQRLS